MKSLLIAHPDKNVYHQLKNAQELSWNKKSSDRTNTSDFENQIKDCTERNEQFALKLVYSAAKSKVGDDIPDSIKDYTTTEYFPYERDLNGLILISEAFQSLACRESLDNIEGLHYYKGRRTYETVGKSTIW